jgi:hypothetical protein
MYRFGVLFLGIVTFSALFVRAGDLGGDGQQLADPPTSQSSSTQPQGFSLAQPLCLDNAGAGAAIHGYVDTELKSAHITPRGLVIADKGVELQPTGALVFDLYDGNGVIDNVTATAGVWNSLNTSLHIPNAGPWFEIDYFTGVAVHFDRRFILQVRYIAFDSPGNQFQTDNNIESTLSYDDGGPLNQQFGLHPYVRLFYNASGSSTVIYGRNGNTWDAELGAVPTYSWKPIPSYPVTITFPTYVTVGPRNFWGGDSNLGVFATSAFITMPVPFIPERFGRWHWDVGVSYFNLLNGKLVDAARTLGCGPDRNRVLGNVGLGFDF